jgi:excisionase family DNA binding protein
MLAAPFIADAKGRSHYSLMENTYTSLNFLTLSEAASILKISKRTLHRMIQTRQIPALKVGGQWRILESRLGELVQEEENTAPSAAVITSPKVVA